MGEEHDQMGSKSGGEEEKMVGEERGWGRRKRRS